MQLFLNQPTVSGVLAASCFTEEPGRVPWVGQSNHISQVRGTQQGGLRSLYRGTILTLARDVPASGCYFGMYEFVKDMLTPEGSTGLSTMGVLIAGGSAGMANWCVAIPPDTLKTRFQTDTTGKYGGTMDVYR